MLLHSLRFDIASDSIDLGKVVACYRSNDLTAVQRGHDVDFRIETRPSARAEHGAASAAEFVENNLCGAPCYYRDGVFTASLAGDHGFDLRYDRRHRSLRADVGPRFAAEPLALVGRLLRPL